MTSGTTDGIAVHARHLADLIREQFQLHQLVPLVYRMLADGTPVTLDQIAAHGGWSAAQVRAELDRHPGLDWDDAGPLAGFGLTLRPTPHRVTFRDRIRPDHAVTDVRAQVCALGNFFASPQAAASWLEANPHGTVVPLNDDFHTTRQAAIELNWTTGRQVAPSPPISGC